MSKLLKFDIKDFKIGQNLYIEASAGTGKTYTIELLVEKMLEEEIPLSKILIVTFTEKATGELRDRIRCKIEDCIKYYDKNKKKKNIFISALREIGNAQIFTIHSFCKNVLKNYAFETKSSINLEVEKGNEIDSIIDRFIRDVWIKEEGVEKLNISDLKIILKNTVNNYLLYYDLKIEENGISDEDKFALKHFQEIISEWQKIKKENNLITFTDMINLVHQKVCGKKNEIDTPLSEARPFRTSNDEYKNRLVESLREAYRYAIIDEFQDTNQKQWDIFRKIFLEKENNGLPRSLTTARNDDSENGCLHIFNNEIKNNIIVVGDPKQSIFAFQGAEIDVYKKAIEEIGEKNGRQLLYNYRSSEAMIKACNELFIDIDEKKFFGDSGIEFTPSEFPKIEINNNDKKAFLNGEEVKPIWLSKPSDGDEYAKYAVSKIVECCKLDESGKTALQIFDKNTKLLRNIKFSDFAVLARTRSEMSFIESEMQKIGIPFYRYKDRTLFDGKECLDWIALLKLLDIPDFASRNRQILNKSLLFDFFRKSIDEIESEELVNPNKKPMSYILEWRKLAEKRQWAELKERIYQDTNIDEILYTESNSINLIKLHQIGNYIFDYLFNHKVSIEEMIKHLKGLVDKTGSSDSEGDIVENTNDLDAVKIMTIHASKGLEFPVVIVVGSLKELLSNLKGPFVYNNEDNIKCLGFNKKLSNSEVCVELRRLMYVAYTRAKYVLILPDFSKKRSWGIKKKDNSEYPFHFLVAPIENIKTQSGFTRLDDGKIVENSNEKGSNCSWEELKSIVDDYTDRIREKNKDTSTKQDAKDQITNLQKFLPSLRSYQMSYSSISSNLKGKYEKYTSLEQPSLRASERGVAIQNLDSFSEEMSISEDFGRLDKEDSIDDDLNENESFILEKFKNIDNPENIIKACSNYISNIKNDNDLTDNYPKGARLGNAIHEIFEVISFEDFGKRNETDIYDISELNNLIIERFEKQSLPIKDNENWQKITAQIVWNTLNADLPVIHGGEVIESKTFKLNSISTNARKAEVEFLFDFTDSESNRSKSLLQESSLRASERGVAIQSNDNYKKLSKLCKGFIDLLFVRKENGIDYYSILDWKSDYMSDESYSDGEALAEKVAEEYTVQRVLYSYLLIKWLKQFYSDLSEEEIFEQHFGGIYYAFVRGCKADCSNGIYAQTWKSYEALEESYNNLLKELKG